MNYNHKQFEIILVVVTLISVLVLLLTNDAQAQHKAKLSRVPSLWLLLWVSSISYYEANVRSPFSLLQLQRPWDFVKWSWQVRQTKISGNIHLYLQHQTMHSLKFHNWYINKDHMSSRCIKPQGQDMYDKTCIYIQAYEGIFIFSLLSLSPWKMTYIHIMNNLLFWRNWGDKNIVLLSCSIFKKLWILFPCLQSLLIPTLH